MNLVFPQMEADGKRDFLVTTERSRGDEDFLSGLFSFPVLCVVYWSITPALGPGRWIH